jgi:hypothetical protein
LDTRRVYRVPHPDLQAQAGSDAHGATVLATRLPLEAEHIAFDPEDVRKQGRWSASQGRRKHQISAPFSAAHPHHYGMAYTEIAVISYGA